MAKPSGDEPRGVGASPSGTAHQAGARRRTVRDGKLVWILREVSAEAPITGQPTYALIADADLIVRRIETYPADWFERDAAELLALISAPTRRP